MNYGTNELLQAGKGVADKNAVSTAENLLGLTYFNFISYWRGHDEDVRGR